MWRRCGDNCKTTTIWLSWALNITIYDNIDILPIPILVPPSPFSLPSLPTPPHSHTHTRCCWISTRSHGWTVFSWQISRSTPPQTVYTHCMMYLCSLDSFIHFYSCSQTTHSQTTTNLISRHFQTTTNLFSRPQLISFRPPGHVWSLKDLGGQPWSHEQHVSTLTSPIENAWEHLLNTLQRIEDSVHKVL